MSLSVRYFDRDKHCSGGQYIKFQIRILLNRQIECCDVKAEEESVRANEVELEVNRTAQ